MNTKIHKIGKKPFAFEETFFDDWKSLRSYFFELNENSKFGGYVFRGHGDESWDLKPTLERIKPETTNTFWRNWYIEAEKLSIKSYERAIHLFAGHDVNHTQKKCDLEWLSIMQHHGAATRLLDVTASPFIAAFFALSDVYNTSDEVCIWAFPLWIFDVANVGILKINSEDKYQEVYDVYNSLKSGVEQQHPIIGYSFLDKPSERPFQQKGGFLFSMTTAVNFENMLSVYSNDKYPSIKKLVLGINDRREIAAALGDFSKMNISFSSLFPGLDGYTKDLLLSQFIVNM